MKAIRACDQGERFFTWLSDWRQFQKTASIGGQLAVLDALAALIPDSSYSLLDEIGLWARECHLSGQWAELRHTFEVSLWPTLPTLETRRDEPPHWYTEAFYWMSIPYRRAALYVSFIDFVLENAPGLDPAPFRALQDWLIAVARWSHAVESSGSPAMWSLLQTSRHRTGTGPMRPAIPQLPHSPPYPIRAA